MERRRPHLDPGDGELIPPPDPVDAMADAAARFEMLIAEPPAGGRGPLDAETLRALREAEITAAGRVVYSSNAVFVVELDAPDPHLDGEPMRAVYKPRRGERPLWDFARHSLHLREAAAFVLDSALDLGIVPPTTVRTGPHGPGSLQLFIHGGDEQPADDVFEARLRDVAFFDVLANNADRKRAHLLLGQEASIWGIDNALTFLSYPRQRTVLIDLGGAPVPDAAVARLTAVLKDAGRLGGLLATLGKYLAEDEVAALEARMRELAADPVYPILDPWDGRPWEGW